MLAIFNREVKRLLKQPKVIFSTFLVPCVLILLMMWVFMSGVLSHEKKALAIVTKDRAYVEKFLAVNEEFDGVLIYTEETEELKKLYDNGKTDVMLVLDLEEKSAEVRYDATKLKSGDNLLLSQQLVRELAMYCSSEDNSKIQAEMAEKALDEAGIEWEEATVADSSSIQQVTESLIGKVDAIYIPTDNLLAEGMSAVAQVSNANGIPCIVGESGMVSNGGLATYGIDYYRLGEMAAEQAVAILEDGKSPADMP